MRKSFMVRKLLEGPLGGDFRVFIFVLQPAPIAKTGIAENLSTE